MCQVDQTITNQLEKTIKQFLDQGRMFTGYDVTVETRERESTKLRHKDVRGLIHEFSCLVDALEWGHEDPQGNEVKWKKSQVDVDGSGQWAFVYHPETSDANQYKGLNTVSAVSVQKTTIPAIPSVASAFSPPVIPAIPSVTSAFSPQTTPSSNDSGGQNPDGTYTTNYRNRLFIQTKFCKELGLNGGEDVTVLMDKDNKRVLLVADYTSDIKDALKDPMSNVQKLERNGDLRLSSQTLRAGGLDVVEDFYIKNETLTFNGKSIRVVEITQ